MPTFRSMVGAGLAPALVLKNPAPGITKPNPVKGERMKLASFSTSDLPQARLGLVQQDEIVDVDLAARALDLQPYEHMQDLLDHYEQGMPVLQAILHKAAGRRLRDVKTFSEIGAAYALSQVELDAPIPRPRKNVMCLGRNYAEHAFESARTRGEKEIASGSPDIFYQSSNSH